MVVLVLLLCPGTSREMPSKVRSALTVAFVGGQGWYHLHEDL